METKLGVRLFYFNTENASIYEPKGVRAFSKKKKK